MTDTSRSRLGEGGRVRIWDLPTRLVHWIIAALFAVSWLTAEADWMGWHRLSGYAVLGLVLFRLYWGLAGSTTARFTSFIKGPKAVGAYAQKLFDRQGTSTPGHNPMGGWSVVALLGLLLLQCGLGLFAVDVDGIESGPLTDLVSFATGRSIAHLHSFVFNLLLLLVGVHLAAMVFYLIYKRDNLVAAMIGGFKRLPSENAPELRFVGGWRAVLGFVLAVLIVAAIATRFRF